MAYSQYIINSTTMTSLANAVRDLWGESSTIKYTPSQMISKINEYANDPPIIEPVKYINSTITSITKNNVSIIKCHAFENCVQLSTVSFPNCNQIDESAFRSCTSLKTVSFPVCTDINIYAFYNCTSLTTISFPKCTSIGTYAFYSCSSLKTASFPKCTYIGTYAFYGCSNLSSLYLNQVTSVTSLPSVNAFSYTPLSARGTGKIYVPNSLLASFKAATNWSTLSARIVGI